MGMFNKRDQAEAEMERAENETIASIIDKNMVIHGEISFQGKTRVDGTIIGNISGEHLVLSETGKVTGDIVTCSFNCFGNLEGNVKANIIAARKNCTIHGKLEAGSLTVEPGAIIDGEIRSAVAGLVDKPVTKPVLEKEKAIAVEKKTEKETA